MIQLNELDFSYPDNLIATEPCKEFRSMWVEPPSANSDYCSFVEFNKEMLFAKFKKGDVLILNTTKVLPRRIINEDGIEILFLKQLSALEWQVLYPVRKTKAFRVTLPDNNTFELIEKGLPQTIKLEMPLTEAFFKKYAEMALPPYIQKARGERSNRPSDFEFYQTAWAKHDGSTAAPTASLHFDLYDLELLKSKGVEICEVLLHVGLGTFLPMKCKTLNEHVMHKEFTEVSRSTIEKIERARSLGSKIWALGTTATRAVESVYAGKLSESTFGFKGETDLFITPGFEFKAIDHLLTNFHQPQSTLLALVSAFVGLENVKLAYQWAIEREFKLFSYGHLSIWTKP